MALNCYKFSLPSGRRGRRVDGIDVAVVMAATQADALSVVQSAYPNLPPAFWASAAVTASNPGFAADYKGFEFHVVANGTDVSYTGVASDSENQVAAGIAAALVAAGVAGSPGASGAVVTLTTPGFNNTACSAFTYYTGNLAALDANINPYVRQNLQKIAGLACAVGGTTSPTFTVPTRSSNAPNIVGFFTDKTDLE